MARFSMLNQKNGVSIALQIAGLVSEELVVGWEMEFICPEESSVYIYTIIVLTIVVGIAVDTEKGGTNNC
jgi:hypothetical protein